MAVPVPPRLSLYFRRYPLPKSTCLMAKSTSRASYTVFMPACCRGQAPEGKAKANSRLGVRALRASLVSRIYCAPHEPCRRQPRPPSPGGAALAEPRRPGCISPAAAARHHPRQDWAGNRPPPRGGRHPLLPRLCVLPCRRCARVRRASRDRGHRHSASVSGTRYEARGHTWAHCLSLPLSHALSLTAWRAMPQVTS